MILSFPTVKDLIAELSKFDGSLPIIISDADTGWTINKIHIELSKDYRCEPYTPAVVLSGEYSEMNSKP